MRKEFKDYCLVFCKWERKGKKLAIAQGKSPRNVRCPLRINCAVLNGCPFINPRTEQYVTEDYKDINNKN
ncbi:hypothetical protein A3A76_00620 [Candidatus Woesebacteria bacterium RIFCSPLOWO2_01_FULL_39_23]|uniref:Uncharacterized protein n=1 Tax=Candidatus Woesebacteria bacterium RIFCSPHIGHO2_01_FULL_40_22 TaxID=1802499 RepID=A0A1F7YKS9_9BACT|nr:MAG: hypothetical protein A2141_05760 [Candidatus Woesebacteria bacterium RBG_16_40_11]OGM27198.1 MAG: hypothetical protein A2628_04140 [Candidatus Woesebacteria bacterium RIFCSPHIGHO2_01_FULL_40_22]OGM63363.1 MAG: hypothetical protein A3A76_00620 [Candidatus Woesebacteria bacterium RIFCSPLOWO2_01_FULL_39_23]